MTFEDHFSGHADAYAAHRPRYPEALFEWLSSVMTRRELAWDVGTGNGQVAVALTRLADRVVGTDASADQLANAVDHDRVAYRNEPADRVSLATESVDLITAGAAAHWFELDGFYSEVRRVAREGAVIALWSYGPRDIAAAIDPAVSRFQEEVLAGFWPERIAYVHARYATLPFPFEEIEAPPFRMSADWNLGELKAFLGTWSASQRYLQERGSDPLNEVEPELIRAWGDPATRRRFEWPLFVRAGRVQ
jgi:SAM-dependent methyltransferase